MKALEVLFILFCLNLGISMVNTLGIWEGTAVDVENQASLSEIDIPIVGALLDKPELLVAAIAGVCAIGAFGFKFMTPQVAGLVIFGTGFWIFFGRVAVVMSQILPDSGVLIGILGIIHLALFIFAIVEITTGVKA